MTVPTTHKAKQPQPLLTRAGIVTAISILAALCAHFGLIGVAGWLGDHKDWLAASGLAVGPLVTGFLARRHVTPTSSPRNNDGDKLEPQQVLAAVETVAAPFVTYLPAPVEHVVDEAFAVASSLYPAADPGDPAATEPAAT